MTSNVHTPASQGQPNRASFNGYNGSNASLLLDRAKLGIRGSTPDSDALVSSDDEHDHHLHRLQPVTSNPAPKPIRRSSWFTDNQQGVRKSSVGANGPFSPVSPGTSITLNEQAPWSSSGPAASSSVARGHSNSSSFPWSNTIWNSDAQKGPPQRLAEVLPSPTSLVPPTSNSQSQDDGPLRSPSLARDSLPEQSIPFSIPLQPTLKSYRSQSYSVGQIEPELTGAQVNPSLVPGNYVGTKRGGSYAGIHHRPSRPSVLGEVVHDPKTLGQLREVDDDEETASYEFSPGSKNLQEDNRCLVEELAGENAMLRQQLVANQMQQSRAGRLSLPNPRPPSSNQYYHQRLQEPLQEEDPSQFLHFEERSQLEPRHPSGSIGRRFSEYGTSSGPHYALSVTTDHKLVDHMRKGQWQSSLGFARGDEPPRSRRHSFAELPTRRNSLGSTGEDDGSHSTAEYVLHAREGPSSAEGHKDHTNSRLTKGDPFRYFSHASTSPGVTGEDRPMTSPAMNQVMAHSSYSRQSPHLQGHLRTGQALYIVTFKCLRADVFYVQEGTGLRVKKGDLVIVEADRGTDLGTVQSDCVSWLEAKQLKEDFTKKHHEWLMAFSHHTQNGAVAGPNPNGPAALHTSTSGSGSSGFQDLPSGEIKPKMIKRLAQPHEVATLREKEGGEAKAKRMCQQKTVDHRLNMEILDAEFQMDWKKLTFFYFADSYINFNPLVTDLFKIYKTRIWMSAINTAAIAPPHAGPRPPGLSLSRPSFNNDYEEYRQGHFMHAAPPAPAASNVAAYNALYNGNRMVGNLSYDAAAYGQGLPHQNYDSREVNAFPVDFRSHNQHAVNASTSFGHASSYGTPHLHHASSFGSQNENLTAVGHPPRQVPSTDWTQSFQAMSLGR